MTMTEANEALMSQLMKHLPTMESFGLHAGGAANATQLRETAQFGDDPGQLRMLSFVPENLGRGAPLVVALHGCTQTAAEYDRGTGWSNLADRYGFAVLLPEQRRGNNPNVCFDWFQPEDIKRGEGEVASIAAMVRNMVAEHGLDPKRVFVTGLSAGGAMTAALLATYPELFAGGAIIAGLPYGSAHNVKEALGTMSHARLRQPREWGDLVRAAAPRPPGGRYPRVAIWQGTADHTVSPANAGQLQRQWGDVHGIEGLPGVADAVDGVPHHAWRDAEGRVVLETYSVPGLGHAVPVNPSAADPDARCGQAGGYFSASGISSSWQIASSWGLTSQRRATTQGARPAADTARAEAPRGGAGQWQGMTAKITDPASVIGRSLRAAGLLGER
jgi:poly(hydroxyalkanoate) depolymerase family esterase